MRTRIVLLGMVFVFCPASAYAINYFYDGGGNYIVDWDSNDESVFVDYLRPDDRTHLDIVSGAKFEYGEYVSGWGNSTIDISGGSLWEFTAYDNCQVTVTGGDTSSLYLEDNSSLNMSGGWHRVVAHQNNTVSVTGGYLYQSNYAGGASTMDITGGYIIDDIAADGEAVITIYGTDFNYDYGEVPVGNPIKWSQFSGNITGYIGGTNYVSFNYYVFDNASIVLAPIPEPTTLFLLGLGAVILRKRRILRPCSGQVS